MGRPESTLPTTIKYATPNAAAKKLMPTSLHGKHRHLPASGIVAKCEPDLYLGEEATKVRDEIWTRIQAA